MTPSIHIHGPVSEIIAPDHQHQTPKRHQLTVPLSKLTKGFEDIPLKLTERSIKRGLRCRRTEANVEGRVKRPLNAFMLYRSTFAERAARYCLLNNQRSVSVLAGQSWRIETTAVRKRYQTLAELEKAEHQAAHPSYKFLPKAKGKTRAGPEGTASTRPAPTAPQSRLKKFTKVDDSRPTKAQPSASLDEDPDEEDYPRVEWIDSTHPICLICQVDSPGSQFCQEQKEGEELQLPELGHLWGIDAADGNISTGACGGILEDCNTVECPSIGGFIW